MPGAVTEVEWSATGGSTQVQPRVLSTEDQARHKVRAVGSRGSPGGRVSPEWQHRAARGSPQGKERPRRGRTRAKEGQAGRGQAADLMMRSEPLAARPADGMSQPALGKVSFSHTVTLGLHAAALRRTELK